MTVTASGPISESLDALVDLLASLSKFQLWTGTDTAAAASAYIHPYGYDEPDGEGLSDAAWLAARRAARPCAIVYETGEFRMADMPRSAERKYSGQIQVVFSSLPAAPRPDSETPTSDADALTQHNNDVGGILKELWQSDGLQAGGGLCILDIVRDGQPTTRTDPQQIGRTVGASAAGLLDEVLSGWLIDWGER